MTTQTSMPAIFAAGETVQYRARLATLGYSPADGYTLKLVLAGVALPDSSPLIDGIECTPASDGDGWDVEIPADDTADLTPGSYVWAELASLAGVVKVARTGYVTVTPNIAAAAADGSLAGLDDLLKAETLLKELDAQILARVRRDTRRMSAFDRLREGEELAQLEALRDKTRNEIATLRRGSDQRKAQKVAFSPPTGGVPWWPWLVDER